MYLLALVNGNVRAYRDVIAFYYVTFFYYLDNRVFALIAGIDNYFFAVTGLFVRLFAESNTFMDRLELGFTGKLRDNNRVVRIP